MESMNMRPPLEAAAPVKDQPATPPGDRHLKSRSLLRRRSLWVIGALLVTGLGTLAYYWTFGKAKVVHATASVERGDVESTVVAAGILQPVLYVDVALRPPASFNR
jgi:multidrug efflux pump subunit AcrA (membrane-fusion protein)